MPLRKRTQDHCKTLPSNAQAEDAEDTKQAERDSVRAPAVERPIAIDLSEPTEYDDGGDPARELSYHQWLDRELSRTPASRG